MGLSGTTRSNQKIAEKAIAFWAVPIYFLSTSYLSAYIVHKFNKKAIAFSAVPIYFLSTSCIRHTLRIKSTKRRSLSRPFLFTPYIPL